MKFVRVAVLAAIVFAPAPASASFDDAQDSPERSRGAQDEALVTRVMTAVRAALAPALPFPQSDEDGSLPVGGNTTSLWMVRPLQAGDHVIEVLANPLNEVHQARATRAMAQIEQAITSAQRRADAQYERALAEAKRTGRSQDVDGVSLSDEGLAGARIDAESHVTIDVSFNQPSYRVEMSSSVAPAPARDVSIPGAVSVISVPSNVFRGDKDQERFCEAEFHVYLGQVAAPEVRRLVDERYEVTAGATPSGNANRVTSLVIRLRGNEALMADILRKGNWGVLLELLK
jgi:hypothetical protein